MHTKDLNQNESEQKKCPDHTTALGTRNASFYAAIPSNIILDKSISPEAFRIYSLIRALLDMNGFSYHSNSHFIEQLGYSESVIRRAFAKLESRGYIVRRVFNIGLEKKRVIFSHEAFNEFKQSFFQLLESGLTVEDHFLQHDVPFKNCFTMRRLFQAEYNAFHRAVSNPSYYHAYVYQNPLCPPIEWLLRSKVRYPIPEHPGVTEEFLKSLPPKEVSEKQVHTPEVIRANFQNQKMFTKRSVLTGPDQSVVTDIKDKEHIEEKNNKTRAGNDRSNPKAQPPPKPPSSPPPDGSQCLLFSCKENVERLLPPGDANPPAKKRRMPFDANLDYFDPNQPYLVKLSEAERTMVKAYYEANKNHVENTPGWLIRCVEKGWYKQDMSGAANVPLNYAKARQFEEVFHKMGWNSHATYFVATPEKCALVKAGVEVTMPSYKKPPEAFRQELKQLLKIQGYN